MERGKDGESLPPACVVFRLWKATNDGQMGPEAFQLWSADRKQDAPRQSVWAEGLTTVAHADAITGGRYALAGFLRVDEVRKIRPDPDKVDVTYLDVQCEEAKTVDTAGNLVP